MKSKLLWIALYPFSQRPTKTRFYERQRPTAVPSPFGLGFPLLFRPTRVRTSSDKQPPVGTQEFFLSPRRIALWSRLRPIQTNSTAFLIIASDTSQYSAVVPIWRRPINRWMVFVPTPFSLSSCRKRTDRWIVGYQVIDSAKCGFVFARALMNSCRFASLASNAELASLPWNSSCRSQTR